MADQITAALPPLTDAFADVLAGNEEYARQFQLAGLPAPAARGLAVITCMDSRIEPLRMLGIAPGDAKIMRNAGARVTDDVLRTLVVATHFLNVRRVMVVAHTRCKMAEADDLELQEALAAEGVTAPALNLGASRDQLGRLRRDVEAIRAYPYLPAEVTVGGFRYDVDSGLLQPIC
jgi:carbonic anhydrase